MSVLIALRAAYRALSHLVEIDLGASDARLHLVRTLFEQGPCGQATVSRLTRLDPAAVTRQLQALEREGLVTRTSATVHAGAKVVALTPAGKAWLDDVQTRREALETRLLEGMDDQAIRRLTDDLSRLSQRAADAVDATRSAERAA